MECFIVYQVFIEGSAKQTHTRTLKEQAVHHNTMAISDFSYL